ncbi:MAG TPA: glycosyltransferase [Polyangia bacterium]|nr:glycosyltransferase [Polyangia bacterium]
MALGITAIISAFNEADVIGEVVADFVAQDIRVYLIDNGSTDDTADEARRAGGRGLLHVERFPEESGAAGTPARFEWESILRRKEQLAQSLDGDWFLHTDADELRESPWPNQTLREGLELADRLGYNALDFAVLNFFPTRDGFQRGDGLRAFFTHFEPGGAFDRSQVKVWKRQPERVDLASSGGHDVKFAGRRVCPVRFLLRHYPVRSQAHGERKIFVERRPRFVEAEQRRGWHVQYARFQDGERFVRDPATLTRFDGEAVRAQVAVRHRSEDLLEHAQEAIRAYETEEARLSAENQQLAQTAAERHRRAEELEREVARLERLLSLLQADTDARRRELEQLCSEHAARTAELHALQETQRMLAQEGEVVRAIAQRERETLLRESAEDRQALLREAGDELQAERRAAEAALAAERARHDEELAAERAGFNARLHAAEERIAELDVRAVQLELARARIAELEPRALDADQARRLAEEREAALAAELREHQSRAAALAGAHETHAAELLREHETHAAELLREHEARVAELSREHESRAAALEQVYDARVAQLEHVYEARVAQLERAHAAAAAEIAELRAALGDAQARVDQILGSRTWRWSAGAREAWRIIGRR